MLRQGLVHPAPTPQRTAQLQLCGRLPACGSINLHRHKVAIICRQASGPEEITNSSSPQPTPASSSTAIAEPQAIDPIEAAAAAAATRSPSPSPRPAAEEPAPARFDDSPVPDALARGASSQAVSSSDVDEEPDLSSRPAVGRNSASSPAAGGQRPLRSPQPIDVASHALEFGPGEGQQQGEDFFATQELVTELKEGLGSNGEMWFVVPVALTILLVICPFKLQGFIDMLGTLSLATGLVSMLYGLISLGRNLSPMPQPRKQHKLVTSGMFAYVRHPMYGGLLMAALGVVCLARSETRLAVTLLLWYCLEAAVKVEESALLQRYGQQYAQYSASVKKLIPFIY